jgi:hypothetical protein
MAISIGCDAPCNCGAGSARAGLSRFLSVSQTYKYGCTPLKPIAAICHASFAPIVENISAINVATHAMSGAVRFNRVLGFEIAHGSDHAAFTSFRAGTNYLNRIAQPPNRKWPWWGARSSITPTLTHCMRA